MDLQSIRQRFGIIGADSKLERALEIAYQVASTDVSVLVTGESGAGKEFIPKIIHQTSPRKHNNYIAVNCGAIPEGTIDSELFGHEKGSFTGANETRKGYFEMADKGTIFLDEVGELPLSSQVRLLRILESKEFMKVGSSKVQKCDVRIVAATNVNLPEAVKEGKFREDLYYRLNSVPIFIPPLRERGTDILLLFRKFAQDFADTYHMPAVKLMDDAKSIIMSYHWPGNVRQLRNITEQISIIEENREISGDILKRYLPDYQSIKSPMLFNSQEKKENFFDSEKELLYKLLFDMRQDLLELKSQVNQLLNNSNSQVSNNYPNNVNVGVDYGNIQTINQNFSNSSANTISKISNFEDINEVVDENLKLVDSEFENIKKALQKNNGNRKLAALDLGISERTLYRKIKEYKIN